MAKLTDTERAVIVNGLCTNCDCLKADADKSVLNTLSDDALKGLKANADKTKQMELVVNSARDALGDEAKDVALNAMPAFIKEKIKAKDDAGDDDDDEEAKKKAAALKKAKADKEEKEPAANRLTAEEQEDLAFARSEKNRQKSLLVNRLTSHLEDGDVKTRLVKNLAAKPLPELQDLALAIAPAVNEQYQQSPGAPLYFGASGGPTANRREVDDTDILPLPTTNWEDEAKRLKQQRA